MSVRKDYDKVFSLLKSHHELFKSCIPLIASENIASRAVKETLISDFGHRYAEGWVGKRAYAGCKYIDGVESIAIKLTKKLFNAEFVDVRPISGVVANLVIYTTFTKPGECMMNLSIPSGGHISMAPRRLGGTAGAVHGLEVEYFVYDEKELNIDVDGTIKKIRSLERDGKTINLFLFGGSVFPFPHPVREIAEVAKEYGSVVAYDAAHVSGLIAGGQFQDPLREGVDAMSSSTHKTLFGPQRGMVLTWNKYADRIKKATFPGLVSNHHLHTLAGLAVALSEMIEFGKSYAKQVIKNAKALGKALYERGFKVLGEHKGFTQSHTLIIDIVRTPLKDGMSVEKRLEEANIIINRNLLPWDIRDGRHYMQPGGIRLGTCEVTRLGMRESEMEEIAEFMKSVVFDGVSPEKVAKDVADFRRDYQTCRYCFEETDAYDYLKIR